MSTILQYCNKFHHVSSGLKLGGGGGGESLPPPLPTPMQTIYADQLHDSVDHALTENTTMEHAGVHAYSKHWKASPTNIEPDYM